MVEMIRKVEITGRPLYPQYNIYPLDSSISTPPHILCRCSDCYWLFRLVDGVPVCQYVTEYSYEEAYSDTSPLFPEVNLREPDSVSS